MDLTAYRRLVGDWLAEHDSELVPHRVHEPGPIEDALAHEAELQRLLWDAGISRWGWPTEHGGLGGDVLLRATLYDLLGSAGITIPEAMTTGEVMGPAMIEFAPDLARRHLTAYLRGDEGWCQAFSEPDAGSDMAAIRVTARTDGEQFVVSGQKTWSSLATVARWCVLLARTGDPDSRHRGLSMLFVDLDQPGVTVRGIRAATGRNEFAELFFDDAVVPRAHLIGALGQGWEIAMSMLEWERGMFGWQRQSVLLQRLERLVISRRADAEQIGDLFLRVAALRASCRRTVGLLASGVHPGAAISADKLLLSAAERATFDALRSALEPALELDDSAAIARLREEFQYSRASSIYGGSAEIQRNIVADRLLDLPRETAHA